MIIILVERLAQPEIRQDKEDDDDRADEPDDAVHEISFGAGNRIDSSVERDSLDTGYHCMRLAGKFRAPARITPHDCERVSERPQLVQGCLDQIGAIHFTSPEDHAQLVDLTVIRERNSRRPVRERLAVQLGMSDATADSARVLDANLVASSPVVEDDLETRPCSRDARRKA
jgi:hypothetical protein